MTVKQAIQQVQDRKPNQYTDAQMIGWLSECDSSIFSALVETHELPEGMPEEFNGYTEDNEETELIARPPFDVLYGYYLESRIDLYNKETNNFNNTITLYNNAYAAYAAWYDKNHMPRSYATHFKL